MTYDSGCVSNKGDYHSIFIPKVINIIILLATSGTCKLAHIAKISSLTLLAQVDALSVEISGQLSGTDGLLLVCWTDQKVDFPGINTQTDRVHDNQAMWIPSIETLNAPDHPLHSKPIQPNHRAAVVYGTHLRFAPLYISAAEVQNHVPTNRISISLSSRWFLSQLIHSPTHTKWNFSRNNKTSEPSQWQTTL